MICQNDLFVNNLAATGAFQIWGRLILPQVSNRVSLPFLARQVPCKGIHRPVRTCGRIRPQSEESRSKLRGFLP